MNEQEIESRFLGIEQRLVAVELHLGATSGYTAMGGPVDSRPLHREIPMANQPPLAERFPAARESAFPGKEASLSGHLLNFRRKHEQVLPGHVTPPPLPPPLPVAEHPPEAAQRLPDMAQHMADAAQPWADMAQHVEMPAQVLNASTSPEITAHVPPSPPPQAYDLHAPFDAAPPPPASSTPPPMPVLPMGYRNPTPPIPRKPAAQQSSLENTIGLKWAGWIGAVVLLIGISLGVRFIWEQGWFASVPRAVWLGLIVFAGFALIGAGEWVYRKIDVIPGASLFGAGIATLFVASYAGYAYYGLYDPGVAFFLMGLATLVGAIISRRGNLVSIAVLSMIGGNLAPALLHTEHPRLPVFLGYLLMLQVVSVALSYLGGSGKWWTLRGLSLVTTSFWFLVILNSSSFAGASSALLISAAALFGIIFQAEVIASAIKFARGTEMSFDLAAIKDAGVHFSILVTAAVTIAGLQIFHDSSIATRAIFIALEAALCGMTSLGLRRNKSFALRPLSAAFAIQFAGFVTVLIPVALSGVWIILGWAILALAMAMIGSEQRPISRVSAVIIWLFALTDLVHQSAGNSTGPALHATWLTIASTALPVELAIAWILAAAGEVVAWLTCRKADGENDENWRTIGWLTSILAAGAFGVESIHLLPLAGSTLALVLLAWVLAISDIFTQRLRFAVQSVIILLIAGVKWALVDALQQRLSPAWSAMDHHPLYNPLVGMGLLLAISLPGIWMLRKQSILAEIGQADSPHVKEILFFLAAGVIAVLTIAFSFEIDLLIARAAASGQATTIPFGQLEQCAFTSLWLASAVALWAAAAWIRRDDSDQSLPASLRRLPIALAIKFIIVDSLFFGGSLTANTSLIGFNFFCMTAIIVAAGLLIVTMLWLDPETQSIRLHRPDVLSFSMALFTILWAGSFEIDRFAHQSARAGGVWPEAQLTQMLWTMWWAVGAMTLYVVLPALEEPRPAGAPPSTTREPTIVLLILLAVKYLVLDTLGWRLLSIPAPAWVLLNPQALEALVLVASLGLVYQLAPKTRSGGNRSPDAILRGDGISRADGNHLADGKIVACGFLGVLIPLWCGSLEIDRAFEHWVGPSVFADPHLAKQVALSVFWAIFAVGSVFAGFAARIRSLRWLGLGLFAITLGKILLVDLGQVSTGYRILSFLGVGGLLLGTSVLYGKLSPKLLNNG